MGGRRRIDDRLEGVKAAEGGAGVGQRRERGAVEQPGHVENDVLRSHAAGYVFTVLTVANPQRAMP